MADAAKGDLVQIHKIILTPDQRPESLPPETRAVPFEVWVKGFLVDEAASLGQKVTIETLAGRQLEGTLSAVKPVYDHGFGTPRPELLPIGAELSRRLAGG